MHEAREFILLLINKLGTQTSADVDIHVSLGSIKRPAHFSRCAFHLCLEISLDEEKKQRQGDGFREERLNWGL